MNMRLFIHGVVYVWVVSSNAIHSEQCKTSGLFREIQALSLLAVALGLITPMALPHTARAEGLLNLRKPDAPRSPVTDIVWPERPGDASICLWEDDKLAAFSYGIDDNCAMNVDWWLEQTKIYNIKITWFLITGKIGGTDRPHMYGSWDLWQKVVAEGHAVESHSVNHLSKVDDPDWLGTEWEYSESRKQIEENIPGYRVYGIAYPGGKRQETNDPNLAANHYLTGRGGYPSPNEATSIDYLSVHAASTPYFGPIGEVPKRDFANFNNILTPDGPNKKQYRGWAFGFSHYVGHDHQKQGVWAMFNWYKEHEAKLWAGLYRDVARYGQERDTATLMVEENTTNRIAFTLSDQMDDRFFDYPLTVKVRIPNTWNNPGAVQGDKDIPVTLVENNGGKFLLVNAVPDRGRVVLQSR
jgi:hypothetical protein